MATSSKSTAKSSSKVAAKPAAKAVAKKAAPVKKAETTATKPAAKSVQITEEAIRNRATEIYIDSGCIPGKDFENWLQAERELKGKKK